MNQRPDLGQLGLGTGKKARLHRILYEHGLGNGTAIFLPYDQGLEHGPRDFFPYPAASDPKYMLKLALEGAFNGIAILIGLAEKFYWDYAGEIPLVLKLNGKTDIPPSDRPLSPVHATVADAVRLGADVVKVNFPHPEKRFGAADPYRHEFSSQEAIDTVVRSANRTLLLVSGGERTGDQAMLEKARQSMEAGATGLIFGRNVWQREHTESLRFIMQLKDILAKYPSG